MNKISMLINKLIIFSGVYFISHSDFWNCLCPTDHSISLLRYCLLSDVILKYNTEFYFYSFTLTKIPWQGVLAQQAAEAFIIAFYAFLPRPCLLHLLHVIFQSAFIFFMGWAL